MGNSIHILNQVFRPFYQERLQQMDLHDTRFAYYTSASTALNILRGKQLWMRAAACMNDYKEIDYGIQLLNQSIYTSETRRQRIHHLVDELGWPPTFLSDLLGDLNRNETELSTHTYLACLSEHPVEEDQRGRLSMWRAYGRKTGVAFVLKARPLLNPSRPLSLSLLPVEYLDEDGFSIAIDRLIESVEDNLDELRTIKAKSVMKYFTNILLYSLFSVKHPGFIEEREWRIIYQEHAHKLDYDLVVVDSVPQIIYKLPMLGANDKGRGVLLNDVLDSIIIGPTEYGNVVYAAFVKALKELGIKNASGRVFMSNIPLRDRP